MAQEETKNMELNTSDRVFWPMVIEMSFSFACFLLMKVMLIGFGIAKKYDSPFYRLIQNVLCYANAWISVRLESCATFLPVIKFLEAVFPGFLSFSKSFSFWCFHTQFYSALTICLIRIFMLVLPVKSHILMKRLTSRKLWYLGYAGVFIIISTVITVIVMPRSTNRYYISDDTLFTVVHLDDSSRVSIIIGAFSLVYFSILFCVRVFMSVLEKRDTRNHSASHIETLKKFKNISTAYCYIYLGILSWSSLNALSSILKYKILPEDYNSVLLGISTDLMTLSLPFILLVYDKNVRADLRRVFKKNNAIHVTSSERSNNGGKTGE